LRKLGVKNIRLFIFMSLLAIIIMGIFLFGIKYVAKIDTTTYEIADGSIVYNDDFQLIETKNNTKLQRSYDSNYYLTTLEEGLPVKYKMGQATIVYHPSDYKMYLYGNFYQVLNSGEVKKIEKKEEVIRTNSPFFYKITDRKYLWVDKKFTSDDGSIQAKDYLIIELDKKGNATLANNEMNEKTINPIILKGSQYDFDIVHEKLIIGKEEIDLKNIIGSSNLYEDPKEENNGSGGNNGGDDNFNAVETPPAAEDTSDYYKDYLKTLVKHFNNLTNSVIDTSQKGNYGDGTSIYLSRWVSLGTIEAGVTSIKVNYNVFDPNNEYATLFLIIKDASGEASKVYLNKEKDSYIISGLQPNKDYTLIFGYQLISSIDSTNSEINDDTVKVKTIKPSYELRFKKITATQIHFYLKMDSEYQAEAGNISLYTGYDTNSFERIANAVIDIEKAKNGYVGTINYKDLKKFVELRVENLMYNGQPVSLDITSRYINQ